MLGRAIYCPLKIVRHFISKAMLSTIFVFPMAATT